MDTKSLPPVLPRHRDWRLGRLRRGYTRILLSVLCLTTLWWWISHHRSSTSRDGEEYQDDTFQPLSLTGYINAGEPGKLPCEDLQHHGQIEVQQSFFVDDDIHAIAASLKDHPLIDYGGQDSKLSHGEIVSKTWLRMASSSVWMERYQVYLTVTRIVFYDKGVKHWPVVSFIRGQIHSKEWEELHDYEVEWQGEKISFPRIFDIPTAYVKGGGFYGPEDPRIIIEEGEFSNEHPPEPVIVFNMKENDETMRRAMYVFRPFTNDTQILNIVGEKPNGSEKNWMPFFPPNEGELQTTRWPSHDIHFVYDFNPLRVLRCHLLNGWCEFVYQQPEIPEEFQGNHNATGGVMRGGSNFFPLPATTPGFQQYVGFPRTHINWGCADGFYRPELMLLTASTSGDYHIGYMTDSIDFDDAAMTEDAHLDPCGAGRILIANSIARWEGDVMTISFTVDDDTTQVLRLRGLKRHFRELLSLGVGGGDSSADDYNLHRSAVGRGVLECSLEAAGKYALERSEPVNGVDLRKQREDDMKKERGQDG